MTAPTNHLWTLIAYNSYAMNPNPRVIYAANSRLLAHEKKAGLKKTAGMKYIVQMVRVEG